MSSRPLPLRPLPLAIRIALPLLAAPSLAMAADTSPASTVLAPVTVTASPLQSGSSELLTPHSVIEGDELVRRRATSLGETLADEPGMAASHFGTAASRPIIRGMDGARVRVLSDGAEIQDASTISPDHAVATDPMLATGIEVLRGPSALVYGGGATGGVVNVLDERVPTAIPEKGVSGNVEMRAGTAARDYATAFGLTAGARQFALHVEGLNHHAGDYRVGRDWSGGDRVYGSASRGNSGSIGASWIGSQGFWGLAYSSQHRTYGLPGHAHDLEGCEADGNTLACPSHEEEEGHDHEAGVPDLVMRTERWDLRGEQRNPFAGVSRVRVRGSLTDYRHDEVEEGEVATTFRNRAGNGRIEIEHAPLAGWRGLVGTELSRRRFSAIGEEAYLQPTDTRRQALFVHEEQRFGDWHVEGAARQEWQRIDVESDQGNRTHNGTSVSAGTSWHFAPGWQAGASLTRAQRLPTAEELYANGLHLATRTWERGNADLKRETSNNLDLSLRKTEGDTTLKLGVYHNRIRNYIHARTLDELDGLQLIEYSQRDARFTGFEGELRQALGRDYALSLLGDYVRAKLANTDDGQNLARIPAARVGLRGEYSRNAFSARAEIFRVASQRRVADHETSTPGYNLINLGASYTLRQAGLEYQFYTKLDNLTNQLAYAHSSFIKDATPLTGRNLTLGVRMSF